MRGCLVIMEQPIACAPQFRSFLPNVLPQTAKNTAVELGVHGLALGGQIHGAQSLYRRKNTMSMLLIALRLCLAFFGLGDPGIFHCEDLFSLRTTFPHPPYSPGLAPCNFFLFPKRKMQLKGRRFDRLDDIQQESHNVLGKLREQDFQHAFQQWQRRWARCVAAQDYFEGDADRT